MAKKLKITQVRSIIGTPEKQRRTIKALGSISDSNNLELL
ncbi:Ribosomal protein L30p/L7e [Candidatus Kryptonium thompsonii]|nr:uL30 family ribosomal protein [Candidatus Kryptonium thompsoni]CUT06068.1 Ribosomal protein L30p/L7e [Candidatus Kryptonium thompsoni]